jgi:hypothetical protein
MENLSPSIASIWQTIQTNALHHTPELADRFGAASMLGRSSDPASPTRETPVDDCEGRTDCFPSLFAHAELRRTSSPRTRAVRRNITLAPSSGPRVVIVATR